MTNRDEALIRAALEMAAKVAQNKHDAAMKWASAHLDSFDGETDSLLIAEEIRAIDPAEVLAKVGDGWKPRPVAIPAEGASIEAMRSALLDMPAGRELVSAGDTGLYWMNHGDAFAFALLPTPPQEAPNE